MKKDILSKQGAALDTLSSRYAQAVAGGKMSIESLLRSPNLFNWFVGITSITVGFVFLLASPLITNFQTGQYANWFGPLQAILVLGGLGLLLSEMAERGGIWWRIIFRVILAIAFAAIALIWWQVGEYDGVFVALWLTIVILLNVVSDWSSLRSYLIFYQGLFVGLPLSFYLLPVGSELRNFVTQLTGGSTLIGIVWLIVIAAYIALSWWGYFNDKRALSRLIGVAGAPLIALAFVYANLSDWVRAFLMLVTALFAFLLPFWDELRFRQGEARRYVMRMFAVITVLFLVTVVLIKIVQNILLSNASLVLSDKLTYGKVLVETTIDSILSAERGMAANPLFVKALLTGKPTDLDALLSGFFKANRSLLRVVSVDSTGKIISAYPLTVGLVGKSIANSNYFDQTKTNNSEAISDSIDPVDIDITGRTVAVSVPVISNGKLVGALVGYLDMGTMSDQLGEIATPTSNQYFVILDRSGNWVVGPEVQGGQRRNDPLVAVSSQIGLVKQGYSQNGVLSLEVSQNLSSIVEWKIILAQPVFSVLAINQTAYVVVLAVTSLSVLVVGLTVLFERLSEEKK